LPRGRPLLACLPDVGPILFAGQQRFFCIHPLFTPGKGLELF
jgi:hypothetical protein